MIVVDTNVVSELMRPNPQPAVRDWVLGRDAGELFTTAITLVEVLYGIGGLPAGRRRDLLHATAVDVFVAFEDRVLAFDSRAAAMYAEIVSGRDAVGRPVDGFDAQIAAICRVHGASLATRNVKDFDDTGLTVIDPWTPGHG